MSRPTTHRLPRTYVHGHRTQQEQGIKRGRGGIVTIRVVGRRVPTAGFVPPHFDCTQTVIGHGQCRSRSPSCRTRLCVPTKPVSTSGTGTPWVTDPKGMPDFVNLRPQRGPIYTGPRERPRSRGRGETRTLREVTSTGKGTSVPL